MTGLLSGNPLVELWLARALLAMAVVIAISSLFLLLHHAATLRREALRRQRIAAAARELAPFLAGRAGASAAVAAAARRYGRRVVSTVLRRARRSLSGDTERCLSDLLEELGETRRLARVARRGGPLSRGRVLRLLAACGGGRARRALLQGAADAHPEVRRIAREGLLELRDPLSVRAAVAAFLEERHLPPSWSRAFLLRLAIYDPCELRRLAAARKMPPPLAKLALEALAETGDAAAAALALAGVRSPAAEMRAAGVRLLGAMGDRRWTLLLATLMADPQWYVRAAAARALGGLGRGHGTLSALAVGLTDSHWWVRTNAARSLARLGPPGMQLLARAAGGSPGVARQAAMPELLRLAGTPPVPASDGTETRDLAVAS